MDFHLKSKKDGLIKIVKFSSFWEFFDEKDSYIKNIDIITWTDRNYEFIFDLNSDIVKHKKDTDTKFKVWAQYTAFKIPVELVTDDDFDF